LIGKHERRFTGFDDKVIALYARGLTVREIQALPTIEETRVADWSAEIVPQIVP
jgi:putative transposase